MKGVSPETRAVLSFIGGMYKNTPCPEVWDLKKALLIAARNRVLYYFVTELLNTGKIKPFKDLIWLKRIGERGIAILQRTLSVLNEILGDEYLLLKTYKAYPYVTADVDVLVKDLHLATGKLLRHGFRLKPKTEKYKLTLEKRGFLHVGLHSRVSWGSIVCLDEDILWERTRKVFCGGVRCLIPSIEGDILTLIAHINFELHYIALGDLLYIYRLVDRVDWQTLMDQVTRYGWDKSFKQTIGIINTIHQFLYNENSPLMNDLPLTVDIGSEIELPYLYPPCFILQDFLEVRALRHLMRELPFYLYRRARMILQTEPCYLDSFLYGKLSLEEGGG